MTSSLISAHAIICVENGKHNARDRQAASRWLVGSPWDEGARAHSPPVMRNKDRSELRWKMCGRPKGFRTS